MVKLIVESQLRCTKQNSYNNNRSRQPNVVHVNLNGSEVNPNKEWKREKSAFFHSSSLAPSELVHFVRSTHDTESTGTSSHTPTLPLTCDILLKMTNTT